MIAMTMKAMPVQPGHRGSCQDEIKAQVESSLTLPKKLRAKGAR